MLFILREFSKRKKLYRLASCLLKFVSHRLFFDFFFFFVNNNLPISITNHQFRTIQKCNFVQFWLNYISLLYIVDCFQRSNAVFCEYKYLCGWYYASKRANYVAVLEYLRLVTTFTSISNIVRVFLWTFSSVLRLHRFRLWLAGSVRAEWNRIFYVVLFWEFITNNALTVLYTICYVSFVIVLDICCYACQKLRTRYIKW